MPPRSFENLGQIPAASLKLLAGSGFKVSGWNGCWLLAAGLKLQAAFSSRSRDFACFALIRVRISRFGFKVSGSMFRVAHSSHTHSSPLKKRLPPTFLYDHQ